MEHMEKQKNIKIILYIYNTYIHMYWCIKKKRPLLEEKIKWAKHTQQ